MVKTIDVFHSFAGPSAGRTRRDPFSRKKRVKLWRSSSIERRRIVRPVDVQPRHSRRWRRRP